MKKIITLSLLLIGIIFLGGCGNGAPLNPPPTGCLHTSEVKFTTSEEARMKEIMLSVMQGDTNMPTLEIYKDFWSIMDKHGKLCEEDIDLTKDSIAGTAECSKLFYQDALISLRSGKTYKSSERSSCELKTFVLLLPKDKAQARIKENEVLMGKIAMGQPILTGVDSVVLTEKIIQSTINDISTKLGGINRLFSESAPLKSSDNQSDSDQAALDKDCERIHGPSVYKSIPGPDGGAYCDCRPGYTLKPMVTADGVPSSWCTKI